MREEYEAIIEGVLTENALMVEENFSKIMEAKIAAIIEDYKTAVSQDMFNVFPFDVSGNPKTDEEDDEEWSPEDDEVEVSDEDDETDDTEHPELDETPEDAE